KGAQRATGRAEREKDDEGKRGSQGGSDGKPATGGSRGRNLHALRRRPHDRRSETPNARVPDGAAQCGPCEARFIALFGGQPDVGKANSSRSAGGRLEVGPRQRKAERHTAREQPREKLDAVGL